MALREVGHANTATESNIPMQVARMDLVMVKRFSERPSNSY
jgi:hypothetical protein